ncbi:MAG TPA: heme exporter protein CcmB [Gemmatimonadales bacterium]|nr:heme exporter protein CcmB [Gemmatimonadales bacterium]
MTETIRQAVELAAKDLRVELRSRTALLSAVIFAAIVLVIFNFARDPASVSARTLAPSVLWVTFSFAAMLTFNRGFMLEKENAAIDGLLLSPMPRGALFLGKYLANLGFVFTVEAVALPLFVLFFNVGLGKALPGLLLVTVLATAGFVAVGTVFSAMAVRTRFADLMLPVLLLPFMVPPIMGAVQVTTRLLAGRPLSEQLGWLRFLGVFDLAFLTLCAMLFPAIFDE